MTKKFNLILILLLPVIYFSQNTFLDTSFNGTGKFFLNTVFQYPNNSTESITDVVEQPDGKVVCLGVSHSNSGFFEPIFCTVFRLNVDGTLDNSFGNNGVFRYSTYQNQRNLFNEASKLLLQNDGSMIISGVGYEGDSNLYSDVVFMKITSNGSVDTSFGNNGISRLLINNGNNLHVYDMISHNNIIYVAGIVNTDGFIGSINTDGSVNTNFNGVGTLTIDDISQYYNNIQRLKIVSNKLLAIGLAKNSTFNVSLSIARVLVDGSMDLSYGTGGIANSALIGEENERILDCTILPNDKVFTIVGGNFYQVNKYGLLDTSFGVNGFIKNPYNEDFLAATITPDKKMILSKYVINGPFSNYRSFKTVGVKSDFTPDSGYLNNGQVMTNVMEPNHYNQAPAKTVFLSNGKTLVAGSVTVLPNPNVPSILNENYVVVRYTNNSPVLQTQEISKIPKAIYPTMVSDVLNINVKEKIEKIEIYDQSGRLIKNIYGNNSKLYLSDLLRGVYVVKVIAGKSIFTDKISKE